MTNRGLVGARLFLDRFDYIAFLQGLFEAAARQRWNVLAYCLMPTHFHLLLECPEGGLSDGMRRLQSDYARRYHRRRDTRGSIYQGRFKAKPVTDDEQMLMTVAYIARNPVKDEICRAPAEWPWSSHRATLRPVDGGQVAVDRLLDLLSGAGTPGLDRYRRLLPDDGGKVPQPVVVPPRPALADVLRRGDVAGVVAAHRLGYPLAAIAERLGCDAATVSRRLAAERKRRGCKEPDPLR